MTAAKTMLVAAFSLLAFTGCAGRGAAADPTASAPASRACAQLDGLQPGQVAGVEPLWVQNHATKSPAYTLGGVIVALRQPGEVAGGACVVRTAPAGDRPVLVLRADDPAEARALLARAEALVR